MRLLVEGITAERVELESAGVGVELGDGDGDDVVERGSGLLGFAVGFFEALAGHRLDDGGVVALEAHDAAADVAFLRRTVALGVGRGGGDR